MRFLVLLTLVACSSARLGSKRRDVNTFSTRSHVVKYFLPELPAWANVSIAGRCHRSSNIKYFDFIKLRKSFSLSYLQAINFQYMFNIDYFQELNETRTLGLMNKDSDLLFFNVLNRIQGGLSKFEMPQYQRIHLVWIDSAINQPIKQQRLKKLLKSKKMNSGHPVLVSLCLVNFELVKFFKNLGVSNSAIRFLSAEMFAPFDQNNRATFISKLDLNTLFTGKELHLFLPEEVGSRQPLEFSGDFQIDKF